VVRRRHVLADLLRWKIAEHGRFQVRRAAEWLIQNDPGAIETSAEFAISTEEENYRPSRLFQGAMRFRKHAFDLIFDMNGEEAECATRIRFLSTCRSKNVEFPTSGVFLALSFSPAP